MTDNQIEKQEFLLKAQSLMTEGHIICQRCKGFGHESGTLVDHYEGVCRKCNGSGVLKRRVKVIVQDLPVGKKE